MENHVTSDPSSESQPRTTPPAAWQSVPQLDSQQAARVRRRNTMVTGVVLLVAAMAGGLFYRLGRVEKQVVWKTHEVTRGEMVVSVIEHDPVLTGKVLKVVNSAYFGLSRQLVSIKHAVVFVGINTIKHLALSIAAIGSLPRRNQAGFDIDDYLRHSLTTGTIARYIARRSNPSVRDIEDYFLAGLIHDIGKVVLALYVPDEYSVVLRHQSQILLHP